MNSGPLLQMEGIPNKISSASRRHILTGLRVCRQESFFFYLFGVEEEDFFGALNLANGETTLFMPRLPSSYAIWLGPIQV